MLLIGNVQCVVSVAANRHSTWAGLKVYVTEVIVLSVTLVKMSRRTSSRNAPVQAALRLILKLLRHHGLLLLGCARHARNSRKVRLTRVSDSATLLVHVGEVKLLATRVSVR